VVGGVFNDRLLEEEEELCIVRRDTLQTRASAIRAADLARPLLVGTTAIVISNNLIVTGGSAVCFSFGTFWNKGCYTFPTLNLKQHLTKGHANDEASHPRTWEYRFTHIDTPALTPRPCDSIISATSTTGNSVLKVNRIRLQSAADFQQLMKISEPVIIEGSNLGSCTSHWTEQYLKESIGDREVSLESTLTKKHAEISGCHT
jgi:tRNA wybutosine-synthesizing protein 4